MASSASSGFFCLFFLFSAVATEENTTSLDLTTPASFDQNVTFAVTENYTVFETTTTPSSGSTEEEPLLPAEPLPESGRLLTPVTAVDRLCPCDDHTGVCDINCCCDRECSKEVVALFTSCSVPAVSGGRQLCSRDVASYSLRSTMNGYSELQSSVQKETSYNLFCIQAQNRLDGLSHPPPELPTDSNFEWLFKQFTSFIFGSDSGAQVSPGELQASPGYLYEDVMLTVGESGQRGMFWLPAAGLTADCVDNSPAAFLKDQSSQCSRRVVLDQDCSSLPALSINTYTDIQLFAGKQIDAAVVPVKVASIILQSTDDTQSELQISAGENLSPVLLRNSLCANVVLKVTYVIRYNSGGEIVNATVTLVLGFVSDDMLPLEQEFQITYVQEDGGDVAVRYSGNPGYVVGLPLVSGTKTADGITRSIDPRDTLSLLHSAEDQDCLQDPQQRSPVLFGLNSVSGCTLRLVDAENCSLVSHLLLDVLRGPNYPQYVASFGNSHLDNPLDWVQIKNSFSPG
uniref:Tectonic domain-containing protein n=2 Tax=Amphiprion ocellaris TaxID=80972 RepID=A0A3Q1B646_AMPOC